MDGGPKRKGGSSGRDPDFEVALGARIRAARTAAGMTQRTLGDVVGISYQKLQKYELGMDRIAVSTLRGIARALGLHPGVFFDEGMPLPGGSPDAGRAQVPSDLLEGIRDAPVASQLLALIEELGGGKHRHEVGGHPPVTPPDVKRRGRRPAAAPTRAVVDPLVDMLRQAGANDAGALAKLLGRALDEAGKILKAPTGP